MPFKWTNPPSVAFTDMYDAFNRRLYYGIFELCQVEAPQIMNWMKDNAPWTDRTGNARAGLAADVIAQVNGILILLTIGRHPNGGTLSYGRYLELAHGGAYAIVGPAVDFWGQIVLADVRKLMR